MEEYGEWEEDLYEQEGERDEYKESQKETDKKQKGKRNRRITKRSINN